MTRLIFGIALVFFGNALLADGISHRVDSHAPIAVMGDHSHNKGEVMYSYRLSSMSMSSILEGNDEISQSDVYSSGYNSAPDSMSMSMHMLGVMIGLNKKVTLIGMLPYANKSMDVDPSPMMIGMGATSRTMESSGIGDIKVGALYDWIDQEHSRGIIKLALSLPTGAIDQKDTMPNGSEGTLGYGMQLGSGTVDLHPAVTYSTYRDGYSWGGQASGTIRVGENDKGYTLGSKGAVTGWVAKVWKPWMSNSVRVTYSGEGSIAGAHSDITNTSMSPATDTANSGRSTLETSVGVNGLVTGGKFKGYRGALEVHFPLTQEVEGIQMEASTRVTFGIQKTF